MVVYKDYLGDGVYALFDGFSIVLRANDFNNPTDQIYLEPSVVSAFNRFNDTCQSLLKMSQPDKDDKKC
jgi:hypothetical protein